MREAIGLWRLCVSGVSNGQMSSSGGGHFNLVCTQNCVQRGTDTESGYFKYKCKINTWCTAGQREIADMYNIYFFLSRIIRSICVLWKQRDACRTNEKRHTHNEFVVNANLLRNICWWRHACTTVQCMNVNVYNVFSIGTLETLVGYASCKVCEIRWHRSYLK